jgi:precorrin-6A synthase
MWQVERYVDAMRGQPSPGVPVRRLQVVGIGAGASSFVTVEAAAAIAASDVFLVIDKGDQRADLAALRFEILATCATARPYRVLAIEDGERDASLSYADGVARWHAERVNQIERVLADEVSAGELVSILVWGDPSLYDSALRIIDQVNDRGLVTIDHTVVPGISSVQVLAARHRIALNRIGGSVLITTGRRLRDGLPAGVDDAVVMLDAENSFTTLIGRGYDIFWGAYLGTDDEILVSGDLDSVADEIVSVRAAARSARGWVFDIYLVRRRIT